MNIAIFGKNFELSCAELEAVLGETPVQVSANAVSFEAKIPNIDRLGGTIKFARLLTSIDDGSVKGVEKHLVSSLPDHLHHFPEEQGKLNVGISWYGYHERTAVLSKVSFAVKKTIKNAGRSVRIVPNKTPELNAASVRSNKLHIASSNGLELLVIKTGSSALLAQTTAVQDINAYADRDQARPMRDAFVGMLPPKLAQTMLNLAIQPGRNGESEIGNEQEPNKSPQRMAGTAVPSPTSQLVADLFCGTGVVLQEAILMGYSVFGSDLSPKMVDYTKGNLDWLQTTYLSSYAPLAGLNPVKGVVEADAATVVLPEAVFAVVSEMYLGEPLSTPPSAGKLEELLKENEKLLIAVLQNISGQLATGSTLCLALPAWKSGKTRKYVSLPLETLHKLGYNPLELTSVDSSKLIYARPDQVVGRKLLLLRKV